ncbi:MAG: hypothetical protein ACREMN_07750 [Gemmatimonadales bacterium]
MRFLLRAGLALAVVVTTACGDDSPTPVDFEDPAAITADLDAVGGALDSDAFRSFAATSFMLEPAAPSALAPTAQLLAAVGPGLERVGGQALLPAVLRGRRLQAMVPALSVAEAQGRLIPDSLYGRVYEWDETTDQYSWQGATVSGLTGVQFVLYALGLDGQVVEPTVEIGTLTIEDQSTASVLQLHIQVDGPGGTPTYLDYTASFTTNGSTSANATVTGSISNGQAGDQNKTLTFDETFNVTATSVRANVTFTLNNPVVTVSLIETATFDDPNLVVTADFRITKPGETIRLVARIVMTDDSTSFVVTVYANGGVVASVNGDPADPSTEWVDAGGEPLTAQDLEALDRLFEAVGDFQEAMNSVFAPIDTFAAAAG